MAVESLVALQVDDATSYRQYRQAMMPLLERCGGGFGYDFEIAEVLKSETAAPINRVFTICFPDQPAMDAFFADPGYLEIKKRYFEPAVSATTIIATYQKP